VTNAQIVDDTSRVFAQGDFEKVEYRLTGPRDARTLEINAVEKSWGPNFVRFDLGLGASVGGDVLFALRGEHKRTWINQKGAEWHNTVQLGTNSVVETALYQPFDVRQRYFVEPILGFTRSLEDIFVDDDRVATYDLQEAYGEFHLGMNLGTSVQMRAGVRLSNASADLETGSGLPENDSTGDHAIVASATYDTRNALALPTSGLLVKARYQNSGSWLDGDQRYQLADAMLVKAYPFRGDSLSLFAMGGGEYSGDLPPYRDFRLGGIRSFPGLQVGQLRGSKYWNAGSIYLWKLGDIQSLFGQAVYAGLRLQAGRMGERLDAISEGTVYGASVNLSARTPLGPVLFSLGGADNGNWELQFGLGRPIEEGTILDAPR
jgi:NTE family protein